MATKFILFTTLLALSIKGRVIASLIAAPQVLAPAPVITDTVDPNPSYSFAYDVQDALTGDSKGHTESRANGIVKGQYNVADSDGTRRIVDYYADPVHGFNAIVRKVPLGVVAKAVAPIAPAVPVARALPAPLPAVPAPLPAFAAPLAAAPALPPWAAAPAPLPVAPSPYAVAGSPLLTRAAFPAPAAVPVPAPARYASPYLTSPHFAPALGRFASPYFGEPAPYAVAQAPVAVY